MSGCAGAEGRAAEEFVSVRNSPGPSEAAVQRRPHVVDVGLVVIACGHDQHSILGDGQLRILAMSVRRRSDLRPRARRVGRHPHVVLEAAAASIAVRHIDQVHPQRLAVVRLRVRADALIPRRPRRLPRPSVAEVLAEPHVVGGAAAARRRADGVAAEDVHPALAVDGAAGALADGEAGVVVEDLPVLAVVGGGDTSGLPCPCGFVGAGEGVDTAGDVAVAVGGAGHVLDDEVGGGAGDLVPGLGGVGRHPDVAEAVVVDVEAAVHPEGAGGDEHAAGVGGEDGLGEGVVIGGRLGAGGPGGVGHLAEDGLGEGQREEGEEGEDEKEGRKHGGKVLAARVVEWQAGGQCDGNWLERREAQRLWMEGKGVGNARAWVWTCKGGRTVVGERRLSAEASVRGPMSGRRVTRVWPTPLLRWHRRGPARWSAPGPV